MEHLIPQHWFTSVESTGLLLFIVAVAMVILARAADAVVEGAAGLASRLGVGVVIIGATLVSIGTTTPEATVSVMAAWSGNPGLALGNAIGSIICDTALIFGLCALWRSIPIDHFVATRHGWLQFGSGALLFGTAWAVRLFSTGTPTLGRGVGIMFLTLLVAYMVVSIYWARAHGDQPGDDVIEQGARQSLTHQILGIFIGLAIVIVSSRVLVGSATELAIRWSVPDAVIAATLVAFGTSLPELVTAIAALRRGHPELILGNVVGADILNVLFVIGAASVAAPLEVTPSFYSLHLPFMLGVLAFFRLAIHLGGDRFPRWAGAPLLGSYILYVTLQYVLE